MIRLAITGASGMIGSRFVQLLPADIALVRNIDRTEGLDILDYPELVRNLSDHNLDVLIHMAAFTDVNAAAAQAGDERGSCYQINVVGTKNIVNLCRELHCHLIHISTDYVFDGKKPTEYTEKDRLNPIEWYGQTKLLAENQITQSDIGWTIARTAYPFVASFPSKLDVVRGRIKQMREGTLPPQFTDHTITPTFVDELSPALVELIKAKPAGIYHVVGDTSLTDFEISILIAKTLGFPTENIKPSSLEEFNKTAPRPYQRSLAMSNQKFELHFGDIFSQFDQALQVMKSQGVA